MNTKKYFYLLVIINTIITAPLYADERSYNNISINIDKTSSEKLFLCNLFPLCDDEIIK
jgi:hypothetical protein